jgi:hypothetical protein
MGLWYFLRRTRPTSRYCACTAPSAAGDTNGLGPAPTATLRLRQATKTAAAVASMRAVSAAQRTTALPAPACDPRAAPAVLLLKLLSKSSLTMTSMYVSSCLLISYDGMSMHASCQLCRCLPVPVRSCHGCALALTERYNFAPMRT